ncbi:hypothetical protein GCM10027090_40220 [Sinomonas soli]
MREPRSARSAVGHRRTLARYGHLLSGLGRQLERMDTAGALSQWVSPTAMTSTWTRLDTMIDLKTGVEPP